MYYVTHDSDKKKKLKLNTGIIHLAVSLHNIVN